MAPRESFSRDEIINAALRLVRREGIGKLTARNVAGELKGSTQPIYRVFENIEELAGEVKKAAGELAIHTMITHQDKESRFLSIGMGYLRFAREEPKLFHLLFMSGKFAFDIEGPRSLFAPLYEKMREDPYLRVLSLEATQQLLKDMFIYTHGLCTLSTVEGLNADEHTARAMLRDLGGKLIALALMEAEGRFNLHSIMKEEVDEDFRS